jgi:hypothetical protein
MINHIVVEVLECYESKAFNVLSRAKSTKMIEKGVRRRPPLENVVMFYLATTYDVSEMEEALNHAPFNHLFVYPACNTIEGRKFVERAISNGKGQR